MRLSALVAITSMAIVLGVTQIGTAQSYGPTPSAPCNDCGPSCGPACGPSCGHGNCAPFKLCLPVIPVKSLLSCLHKKATCGSGCGDEVYWGEWWSDPPKCDPCDCHGNFTGPTGKICHPGLLGVRYGNRCCGCDSSPCSCGSTCGGDCGADCGCGHGHGHAGPVSRGVPTYAAPQEGEIIYEEAPVMTTSRMGGQRVYASPTRTVSQPTYSARSYPTSTAVRSGSVQRNPRNLGRDSY